MENVQVWAFAQPADEIKPKIYDSILNGISRFGWSNWDEADLNMGWSKERSQQWFLWDIKPNDWIVHVNVPWKGQCTAVKVTSTYWFEKNGGVETPWGQDYRHCISVDKDSVITFERKYFNPSVNLTPRSRYQRVYNVEEFLKSIENYKNQTHEKNDNLVEDHHFITKNDEVLNNLTRTIQEYHKSKNLEKFLAKVFWKLPNITDVKENGFGWKTDNGADLIITAKTEVATIEFENKIVVQIKSYTGEHWETNAIEQLKNALEVYSANTAFLMTTAKNTENLTNYLKKTNEELEKTGKRIELFSDNDIAKFVLKYAPELVFDMSDF